MTKKLGVEPGVHFSLYDQNNFKITGRDFMNVIHKNQYDSSFVLEIRDKPFTDNALLTFKVKTVLIFSVFPSPLCLFFFLIFTCLDLFQHFSDFLEREPQTGGLIFRSKAGGFTLDSKEVKTVIRHTSNYLSKFSEQGRNPSTKCKKQCAEFLCEILPESFEKSHVSNTVKRITKRFENLKNYSKKKK